MAVMTWTKKAQCFLKGNLGNSREMSNLYSNWADKEKLQGTHVGWTGPATVPSIMDLCLTLSAAVVSYNFGSPSLIKPGFLNGLTDWLNLVGEFLDTRIMSTRIMFLV